MSPTRTARRPASNVNGTARQRATTRNTSAERNAVTSTKMGALTVPGIKDKDAAKLVDTLQERLVALIDTALTLKHIHWNVVGPAFIGVHMMLDPQVAGVQKMVDTIAERIATLGGSPNGLPGRVAAQRTWDDYELGRANSQAHLAALDIVYTGLIESQRKAIKDVEDIDPVTHDMLVQQSTELEQYQWFVRAHLEDGAGGVAHRGERTELAAAAKAVRRR